MASQSELNPIESTSINIMTPTTEACTSNVRWTRAKAKEQFLHDLISPIVNDIVNNAFTQGM